MQKMAAETTSLSEEVKVILSDPANFYEIVISRSGMQLFLFEISLLCSLGDFPCSMPSVIVYFSKVTLRRLGGL